MIKRRNGRTLGHRQKVNLTIEVNSTLNEEDSIYNVQESVHGKRMNCEKMAMCQFR